MKNPVLLALFLSGALSGCALEMNDSDDLLDTVGVSGGSGDASEEPPSGPGGFVDSDFGTAGVASLNPTAKCDQFSRFILDDDSRIIYTASSACSSPYQYMVGAFSIDGDVETGFGDSSGYTLWSGPIDNASTHGVAQLSDGRFLIVGSNSNAGVTSSFLYRFNGDGTVDSSFGTGGELELNLGDSLEYAQPILASPGERVLVGFARKIGTDPTDACVGKFTEDGALDTSFAAPDGYVCLNDFEGNPVSYVQDMKVDSQGRILLGVQLGGSKWGIARFTAAGAPDTTFNSTGSVGQECYPSGSGYSVRLAVQSDDKVLVTGQCSAGGDQAVVKRYNVNGSLDTDFADSGTFILNHTTTQEKFSEPVVDGYGRIVLTGFLYNGSNYQSFVSRLLSDGTLDTNFGTDGILTLTFAAASNSYSVMLDSEDRILVGGQFGSYPDIAPFVVRITP